MDSVASAALSSWTFSFPVVLALLASFALYWRGWRAGRRLLHRRRDFERLFSFIAGLTAIAIALNSPLNSFDSFFLSAHMVQHMLLIMVAPPLLLRSQPKLPFLRALPKRFVKEGLSPFLTSPGLHRCVRFLTSLPFAWAAAALSTVVWHTPAMYEWALSSPAVHEFQHGCFFWTGLLFWWPLIPQGPEKPRYPQWAYIPYLLFADMVNTALSAFFVFSGTVIYPSYQVVRLSNNNPVDDQALAGAIMWVPGSLIYLIPAFILASRLLRVRLPATEPQVRQIRHGARETESWLRAKKLPALRRVAQVTMLVLAGVVMAHGFFGPQAAPVNLAGTLPWIYWRVLSVLALIAVGNLFCLACPFTLVRDYARKLLPARARWPRALRNKWLAIALIAFYLWTYEAFNLWSSPWVTAWIMAGYFAAAVLVDGFFKGASFCKYVCPIGQFHFVTSLASPREVTTRSAAVCQSCTTYDCIRGNAHSRGCELDLFQPRKSSNLDCTFCMDCVKACPHDNVALLPILPAARLLDDPRRSSLGRLSRRTDWAILCLLIVFGAFVNAAGMIEPVMMWEHGWHARLGPHAMPLIVGLFTIVGSIVAPVALALLNGCLNHLADRTQPTLDFARRFSFGLVPLGVAMWAAHLAYHLFTALPLGTDWLPYFQILLLNAGLLLTAYVLWKTAGATARRTAVFLPWATLAVGLYVVGVTVLLQPMQMRGTMMMH